MVKRYRQLLNIISPLDSIHRNIELSKPSSVLKNMVLLITCT